MARRSQRRAAVEAPDKSGHRECFQSTMVSAIEGDVKEQKDIRKSHSHGVHACNSPRAHTRTHTRTHATCEHTRKRAHTRTHTRLMHTHTQVHKCAHMRTHTHTRVCPCQRFASQARPCFYKPRRWMREWRSELRKSSTSNRSLITDPLAIVRNLTRLFQVFRHACGSTR